MRSTTKLIIIHSPVWMVLVGLAARVVYMVIAHSYQAIAIGGPNGSVNELERLAYSLATGSGFSAPYVVDTGPSAWAAPIYPWLISLAFRRLRRLLECCRGRHAAVQQHLRCPHQLDPLSHRASRFQRKRGRVVRMGLGVSA